jgi:hypothetical protein
MGKDGEVQPTIGNDGLKCASTVLNDPNLPLRLPLSLKFPRQERMGNCPQTSLNTMTAGICLTTIMTLEARYLITENPPVQSQ